MRRPASRCQVILAYSLSITGPARWVRGKCKRALGDARDVSSQQVDCLALYLVRRLERIQVGRELLPRGKHSHHPRFGFLEREVSSCGRRYNGWDIPLFTKTMKPWQILLFLPLAAASFAQTRDAEFNKLADRFFDEVFFRFDPVQGTQAGFHQSDAQLPSMSGADVQAEIAALRKFEGDFQNFDARGLSPVVAADRELALAQIRGRLLTLESIRAWEKNPDLYSSGVTNAIFVVMSRNYAPPAERLKLAIARERLIPRVFQSARENLKNPPRVYTEVALEQLPGIVSFFQNDVPAAFRQVADAPLKAEFQKT